MAPPGAQAVAADEPQLLFSRRSASSGPVRPPSSSMPSPRAEPELAPSQSRRTAPPSNQPSLAIATDVRKSRPPEVSARPSGGGGGGGGGGSGASGTTHALAAEGARDASARRISTSSADASALDERGAVFAIVIAGAPDGGSGRFCLLGPSHQTQQLGCIAAERLVREAAGGLVAARLDAAVAVQVELALKRREFLVRKVLLEHLAHEARHVVDHERETARVPRDDLGRLLAQDLKHLARERLRRPALAGAWVVLVRLGARLGRLRSGAAAMDGACVA